MFLVAGILFLAVLILFVLYYFVFRKLHRILSYLVLFAVSIALMFTMFMHLIITGIIVLTAGLFLVKIAELRKEKAAVKQNYL